MILPRRNATWVIVVTFVAAFALSIVPLPRALEAFRPLWPALVVIYWCMALPHRIGVVAAWFAGLFEDVLKGSLLGQHALAFAIVAYLTLRLHQRLRLYPRWQQAGTVLLLLALAQLIIMWINGFIGYRTGSWLYWMPSLTGAALWPVVFSILRGMRRRFRVS